MGFEFATGEQAHIDLLYPPQADRDLLHAMLFGKLL
jgi:hypothetical protein